MSPTESNLDESIKIKDNQLVEDSTNSSSAPSEEGTKKEMGFNCSLFLSIREKNGKILYMFLIKIHFLHNASFYTNVKIDTLILTHHFLFFLSTFSLKLFCFTTFSILILCIFSLVIK